MAIKKLSLQVNLAVTETVQNYTQSVIEKRANMDKRN